MVANGLLFSKETTDSNITTDDALEDYQKERDEKQRRFLNYERENFFATSKYPDATNASRKDSSSKQVSTQRSILEDLQLQRCKQHAVLMRDVCLQNSTLDLQVRQVTGEESRARQLSAFLNAHIEQMNAVDATVVKTLDSRAVDRNKLLLQEIERNDQLCLMFLHQDDTRCELLGKIRDVEILLRRLTHSDQHQMSNNQNEHNRKHAVDQLLPLIGQRQDCENRMDELVTECLTPSAPSISQLREDASVDNHWKTESKKFIEELFQETSTDLTTVEIVHLRRFVHLICDSELYARVLLRTFLQHNISLSKLKHIENEDQLRQYDIHSTETISKILEYRRFITFQNGMYLFSYEDCSFSHEMECVVCLDAKVSIILVPCGHVCVCQHCSHKLHLCPLCRSSIDKMIVSALM